MYLGYLSDSDGTLLGPKSHMFEFLRQIYNNVTEKGEKKKKKENTAHSF